MNNGKITNHENSETMGVDEGEEEDVTGMVMVSALLQSLISIVAQIAVEPKPVGSP
jgi:hypothetical protein